MVEEGVEFGLESGARRIDEEGEQPGQRQEAIAGEGGGRGLRRLGERLRHHMRADFGEGGMILAKSLSWHQKLCEGCIIYKIKALCANCANLMALTLPSMFMVIISSIPRLTTEAAEVINPAIK